LSRKPNVLILFNDDLRASAVAAYGREKTITPNMDRLVAEGTAFTNCYLMGSMTGAVCVPTRAMLLTGRSLFHLDIIDENDRGRDGSILPPETPTLPETFRANGYTTFSTGKWHQDKASFARSFEHAENVFFGGMHWLSEGGHHTPILHDFDPEALYPDDKASHRAGFSSELFADSTIKFLNDRDQDRPFLAYVPFTSPHDPRHAPKQFQDLYPPEDIELPPNFASEHPFDNGEMIVRDEQLAPVPRTESRTKQEISDYYAMVSEVDHQFGRILDELDRLGLAENTIVVFAADHGVSVGQHGLLGKQNVYEHSTRVPMVLRGPGIPVGETRDTFIHTNDVNPTLYEMTGVPAPDSVEMTSFLPAINNKAYTHRDSVAFSYSWHQRAIRRGNWKLAVYCNKGEHHTQLYDLSTDPWETTNLAADHPQLVTGLKSELAQMLLDCDDVVDINLPNWGQPQGV
jgi:arylsulfatase A-like enzyme